MIHLETEYPFLSSPPAYVSRKHNGDKVLVYERGVASTIFVFNFHPTNSFADYRVGVAYPGSYKIVLNTDRKEYDGHGRIDESIDYNTSPGDFDNRPHSLLLYVPSRTALVLARKN